MQSMAWTSRPFKDFQNCGVEHLIFYSIYVFSMILVLDLNFYGERGLGLNTRPDPRSELDSYSMTKSRG